MFKRRDPKTWLRTFVEFIYPRGGWKRAASYVGHRLRRLPDPPHRIARGIAAGVFVCFTPYFGFHFFLAAGLAWVMQGNVVAALLATFFGNPLTFPIIAAISLELGQWMLGTPFSGGFRTLFAKGAAIHITNPKAILSWGSIYAIVAPATATPAALFGYFGLLYAGSILVFIGYAFLFSSERMVRAYAKARRWFDFTFAGFFGFASFKILTARLVN